jgi:hypothetical protein
MGHCQSLYLQTDAQSGSLHSCRAKPPNTCAPALPGWIFVATWNKKDKLMAHNDLQCILDHWPADGVWLLRSWYCRSCGNDTTPHVEPVEQRITCEHARELVESNICLRS